MFTAELRKPRFSEFDIGGVLHHSNYLKLFEELREAWLEANGLPYSELVSRGYHVAVVGSEQQFLKPIYYDQRIRGEVDTESIGRTSFSVDHRIYSVSEPQILLSTGVVRLVLVKRTDGSFKPERLFDQLKQILTSDLRSE